MNQEQRTPQRSDAAPDGVPARDSAWWRVGMVWMVIGGPLAVVLASVVTAVIAVRGADPLVTEAASRPKTAVATEPTAPAMQARNHAATPAR